MRYDCSKFVAPALSSEHGRYPSYIFHIFSQSRDYTAVEEILLTKIRLTLLEFHDVMEDILQSLRDLILNG